MIVARYHSPVRDSAEAEELLQRFEAELADVRTGVQRMSLGMTTCGGEFKGPRPLESDWLRPKLRARSRVEDLQLSLTQLRRADGGIEAVIVVEDTTLERNEDG